ncbi:MAG: hypothetical protein WBB45_22010 [Cyclobacteriaceae bacterium]
MKRFHLVRSMIVAFVLCGALMACENDDGGSDDDDDEVENISEQDFEASREQTLNMLDDYLDSLNTRKRVLSDSVNVIGASEDSTGVGRYEKAIENLESTRISIREQYGVMQTISDEEWDKIARMVRSALERTENMTANQDSEITDTDSNVEEDDSIDD